MAKKDPEHINVPEELIGQMRQLRHEFMNSLQIIMGMVQTKKEPAIILNYISELSTGLANVGRFFDLNDRVLASHLSAQVMRLILADYKVEVELGCHADCNCTPTVGCAGKTIDNVVDFFCMVSEEVPEEDKMMYISCNKSCQNCQFAFSMPYWEPTLADSTNLKMYIEGFEKQINVNNDIGMTITLNVTN